MKCSLVVVIILLLFSCNIQDSKPKIADKSYPVNFELKNLHSTVESLTLSDIAEDVEYIPFETREGSYFGNVSDIKFSDEFIFVRKGSEILQFDIQGKFVRPLFRVGRGPGEFMAANFYVNNKEKNVFVYDGIKDIYVVYNFHGARLGTFEDPNTEYMTGSNFLVFNRKLIFDESIFEYSKYDFMVFDLDGEEMIYKHQNNKQKYEFKTARMGINDAVFFQTLGDTILFKEFFCDTIYHTTNFDSIMPRYILKDLSNKLLYKEYCTMPIKSIQEKYFIQNFFETSSFVFLWINSNSVPNYFWVYDKSNKNVSVKELTQISDYVIENDFDSGPDISIYSTLLFSLFQEEYIYSFVEPFQLLAELNAENSTIEEGSRLYELARNINENDNSVLIKIKLKEK